MSERIDQDVKTIQELLSKEAYQAVYDRYAPVLQEMLFVQSPAEWLDFIRQEGGLEAEPLELYLSAWRGERLLLGCYEGDVTQKVLDYLRGQVPEALLEALSGLPPIVLDIDELDGTLEKQLTPYQEAAAPFGAVFQTDFEDIYCAGAYFLSVNHNSKEE